MLTNDEMSRMPWTRHLATDKEIHEWLASRKAAGEAIDIETCELGNWYINEAGDPYDLPASCARMSSGKSAKAASFAARKA